MMTNQTSLFTISIDFELLWGVLDTKGEEYYDEINRVHIVIPKILELFSKYGVACTWASVGALTLESFNDFLANVPDNKPNYLDSKINPYKNLDKLKQLDPSLLFAPDLINLISSSLNQELGSHSFIHYYCLEKGQDHKEFNSDLETWQAVAKAKGLGECISFVFPRNQYNPEYLNVCKSNGIRCYRGNAEHWAYKANSKNGNYFYKRIFRLFDAYIPLSGPLTSLAKQEKHTGLVNIPASLFLRPYNSKFKIFEKLKILRIKYSMKYAARKNQLFHLWWHPHNFSKNIEHNLEQLEEILVYYTVLNREHGMRSCSMGQIVNRSLYEISNKL